MKLEKQSDLAKGALASSSCSRLTSFAEGGIVLPLSEYQLKYQLFLFDD